MFRLLSWNFRCTVLNKILCSQNYFHLFVFQKFNDALITFLLDVYYYSVVYLFFPLLPSTKLFLLLTTLVISLGLWGTSREPFVPRPRCTWSSSTRAGSALYISSAFGFHFRGSPIAIILTAITRVEVDYVDTSLLHRKWSQLCNCPWAFSLPTSDRRWG